MIYRSYGRRQGVVDFECACKKKKTKFVDVNVSSRKWKMHGYCRRKINLGKRFGGFPP